MLLIVNENCQCGSYMCLISWKYSGVHDASKTCTRKPKMGSVIKGLRLSQQAQAVQCCPTVRYKDNNKGT